MTGVRRCGGTPARAAYSYVTEEVNDRLDYVDKTHRVRFDEHEDGCGRIVDERFIGATAPAGEDTRPLFARSALVVICPYCDAPEPTR